MSPQLTVHNAQISTAKVEIKTLAISGKQVTLSVFRQLIEEPLINEEDGALNGAPWGTVNYHPDKCGPDRKGGGADHLHVVWQRGEMLRRSNVECPAWWKKYFFSEGADELVQAAYCLNSHSARGGWQRYSWEDCGAKGSGVRFALDDVQCEAVWWPDSPTYSPSGRRDEGHKCRTQEDYDEYLQWVREDIAQEKKRRARINGHWKVLNDLPQLFIAV